MGSESLNASIMKVNNEIMTSQFSQAHTTLFEHIREYSTRSWTYETDNLDAFKVSRIVMASESLWGIPISTPREPTVLALRAFAIGLLWTSTPPTDEMIGIRMLLLVVFPSWPLASSYGQVEILPTMKGLHPLNPPDGPMSADISMQLPNYTADLLEGQNVSKERSRALFASRHLLRSEMATKVHFCGDEKSSSWTAKPPRDGESASEITDTSFGLIYGTAFLDSMAEASAESPSFRTNVEEKLWSAIRIVYYPTLESFSLSALYEPLAHTRVHRSKRLSFGGAFVRRSKIIIRHIAQSY
jgi:hypothetical protein